ncbi:MAG TPA: lytic transglycosylase domain-containing protein [Deltaproteobacteria bacterium]|nr:lytic transglycosylase domain-containing protein [Deltaproteobacteria bacterium]
MPILLPLLSACCVPLSLETADPVPEPAPVEIPEPPPPPEPEPVDLSVPDAIEALAERLIAIETEIRDPQTPLERLPDLGHAEQRILRRLGGDKVAADAVLGALPDPVSVNVKRLLDGTISVAHTVPVPKTDLPAWKIVDPLPPDVLLGYYKAAEIAYGVPWTVLASINLNETRMGQLRGLSPVGAQGPMQFMPATWAKYGTGDPNNDRDAIMAAGHYISKMGWATDREKAIWHYNHSPAYVRAILLFSEAMREEPRMFYALRGWKVYYRTVAGSIWLRTGYEQPDRIPIAEYCDEVGEPYCPAHP